MGDISVIRDIRNILFLASFAALTACNQFYDINCDKIAMAVATGVEKNSGLGSKDIELALHLRDTVVKTGSFHSYDDVQKACQRIKYDPNYRY
tara:strand:- start:849 stop:1127 length:279 start_codon:yes stop_codon:yes gene_type:complete